MIPKICISCFVYSKNPTVDFDQCQTHDFDLIHSKLDFYPSSPNKISIGFAVSNPVTHPNAGDIMTAKV